MTGTRNNITMFTTNSGTLDPVCPCTVLWQKLCIICHVALQWVSKEMPYMYTHTVLGNKDVSDSQNY